MPKVHIASPAKLLTLSIIKEELLTGKKQWQISGIDELIDNETGRKYLEVHFDVDLSFKIREMEGIGCPTFEVVTDDELDVIILGSILRMYNYKID